MFSMSYVQKHFCHGNGQIEAIVPGLFLDGDTVEGKTLGK